MCPFGAFNGAKDGCTVDHVLRGRRRASRKDYGIICTREHIGITFPAAAVGREEETYSPGGYAGEIFNDLLLYFIPWQVA